MVKRICIMFPDGSLSVAPNDGRTENDLLAGVRREATLYNRGETDAKNKATIGAIEVDLMSFREMF